MEATYEIEEMEQRYKIVLFKDPNGDYTSNCKTFQSEKHLSDYISCELTNYGRKEVGIYSFDTWEELIEFRILNRRMLN